MGVHYFDTKYMTVFRIEHILHYFEDQKIANFFNLEQVNFRMTLVTVSPGAGYTYWLLLLL